MVISLQENPYVDSSFSDEATSDVSSMIEFADDSVTLPTPPLIRHTIKAVDMPHKVYFMDLTQLDKFIEQLNHIRACVTPGCIGELTPIKVYSLGLGGAVSIKYNCNGCANYEVRFETSSKYEFHNSSDISVAVQVALWLDALTPRITKH